MTNTINKVIRNGTEYEFNAVNGGVTSVNTRTGAVTGLAEDNAVVKLTGNQTVAGTKTFSTSPVVPSKTSDAANTGTAIATEAQVYKKANKSDVLTKTNTNAYTPTANYHPATKKYVDDQVNTAGNGIDITNKAINARVGNGLEIGDDYSAMRGPCPAGFHIPKTTEIDSLMNSISTLGISNVGDIQQYLKIALCGRRKLTNGDRDSEGTNANIWTNTYYSNNNYKAFKITTSTYEYINTGSSNGFSIRPFKDTPTIPNNTWTTLYDGSSVASGAGIFRNSSLGLISISSDGQTWITITDKNVGATAVYNYGDTMSEANCGGFFQWGNNYMFPYTGTITTSSTQVDASTYGPGNYYYSSTFINRPGGSGGWDSSDNKNLRGGVTGMISNAIINAGVTSVNGETGDVIVDTSEVSGVTTEQPANPVAGSTYFDTTNNVLMVYDGSAWSAVGGSDYSWVTKTISSGQVELGLRTIVNHPGSNFTLTAPATLKEGEEYVIRTISEASYTMTLGTGFTNPRNVDLTLSQYATDQFAFLAVGGNLELQPLVATGS